MKSKMTALEKALNDQDVAAARTIRRRRGAHDGARRIAFARWNGAGDSVVQVQRAG